MPSIYDVLADHPSFPGGVKLSVPANVPRDRPVAVYCVYGFQVSGDAVAELRRRGVDARVLSGGIAAWRAIGAPTAPLTPEFKRGDAS